MTDDQVSALLYCVSADPDAYGRFMRMTVPLWARSIGYRLFSSEFLCSLTARNFVSSLTGNDIAYIWPGTQIATFRKAKAIGSPVIAENINTHQTTSKRILDAEYSRLGMEPAHGITVEDGAIESDKLKYSDYVFSPSPGVTDSLLEAGVAEEKIIPASYGLSEGDVLRDPFGARAIDRDGIAAIFVGRIGIRKGAHLLLDYWVKSGVRGKLKLVGNIEANARHLIEPYLSRRDIEHVGYCKDLRPIYRDADVFLFPSLEEGSPLVTYLCLGTGLPAIVSPMGSGGVIRNDQDGMVLDPHDEKAWVAALRRLATDAEMRLSLGRSAYANAAAYLWDKVGRQRLDALKLRIGNDFGVTT
jgi:glycosyltransferase involved in cell wall biosynthesis